MKKRIISMILVVVMLVLSLASCAPARYDFASVDADGYATFDLAAFKEKLAKIVVEDGDFTGDEAVRQEKVTEKIYSSMITNIEAKIKNDESLKNTDAALSMRDVLYYVYYCTATVNEKNYVFYTSHMDTTHITGTNSTDKSDHMIKLSVIDEDSELQAALKAALEAVSAPTLNGKVYGNNATKGTKIEKGDTVVLSYTVTYTQPDGEGGTEEVDVTVNYSAPIKLDDTTDFGKKFFEDKTVATVGSVATFGADKDKDFTITEDGVEKTYSNITIKWIVDEAGEELVSFKHTLFPEDTDAKSTKVKDDLTNVEIDLKNVELTYHVYPVYAVTVPEITAETVIKVAIGSGITEHSMLLFEDESYTVKEGDKTLTFEDLIKRLTDTNDEGDKIGAYAEFDTAVTAMKTAKTNYDKAKEAVDKAGDKATDEQKKALTDAEKALNDAKAEVAKKDKAIDDVVALFVAAASTESGAKPASEAIINSYRITTYDSLKSEYDKDITQKVGKEIYKAMLETVEVKGYPQSVVDELYKVYYERYEYTYYTGTKEGTSQSNYSYYVNQGGFEAYLAAELGAKALSGDLWNSPEGINAKLDAKIKEAIKPIIVIYAVSKEFSKDSSVLTNLEKWVNEDIEAGVLDDSNEVHRHNYETDEEYEEAKAEAEKNKAEQKEEMLEAVKTFLYDNGTFDSYVKDLGSDYDSIVNGYTYLLYGFWEQKMPGIGDIGLRASVQTNKLFSYLLSTVYTYDENTESAEIAYETVDGKYLIDFHNDLISYTVVDELPEADGDNADGGDSDGDDGSND